MRHSLLYVKNGLDNIGVLVYVVVEDVHALRLLQELRRRPHPISRLRVAHAHLSYLSTRGNATAHGKTRTPQRNISKGVGGSEVSCDSFLYTAYTVYTEYMFNVLRRTGNTRVMVKLITLSHLKSCVHSCPL